MGLKESKEILKDIINYTRNQCDCSNKRDVYIVLTSEDPSKHKYKHYLLDNCPSSCSENNNISMCEIYNIKSLDGGSGLRGGTFEYELQGHLCKICWNINTGINIFKHPY